MALHLSRLTTAAHWDATATLPTVARRADTTSGFATAAPGAADMEMAYRMDDPEESLDPDLPPVDQTSPSM